MYNNQSPPFYVCSSHYYKKEKPDTEQCFHLAVYLFRAGDFPASSWTDTSLVERALFEESGWIKL